MLEVVELSDVNLGLVYE